jgi:hypothetical protein
MKWKNKNAKWISEVLLVSFTILSICRLVFKKNGNEDMTEIINWSIFGIALSLVILKIIDHFFPKWFSNRPSREELE